jgi:hypothetical protein
MAGNQARTRTTPHADPERENWVLAGSIDSARDTLQLSENAGIRRRRNGVLAIELILTASPTYFRPNAREQAGEWHDDRLWAWTTKALDWAQNWFGGGNEAAL